MWETDFLRGDLASDENFCDHRGWKQTVRWTLGAPDEETMALKTYSKGVFGWSRYQPDRWMDFNGTALMAEGDTVLIVDPVAPDSEEWTQLRSLGRQFAVILLNADHERASESVAYALDAPLYVPQNDIPLVKTDRATPFADGHVFPGGFVSHVVPNMKTPGESILYHAERQLLVVGDAVIGDPIEGLRLVPAKKLVSVEAALSSLHALLDLSFDSMYLGDGFVVPSGAKNILHRFLITKGNATR